MRGTTPAGNPAGNPVRCGRCGVHISNRRTAQAPLGKCLRLTVARDLAHLRLMVEGRLTVERARRTAAPEAKSGWRPEWMRPRWLTCSPRDWAAPWSIRPGSKATTISTWIMPSTKAHACRRAERHRVHHYKGRTPGGRAGQIPSASTPDPNGVSLLNSVQPQLCLKLKARKGPVELMVVDHIEKTPLRTE
jgi:hypothetical protein